jgi:hypothetical protein
MPQKYEREIDDILRRLGGTLPSEPPPARVRLLRERVRWQARLPRLAVPRVTPSGLLLASIGLALLSYILQAFQPALAAGLALLAFLLFSGSIVTSIVRGRRRPALGWRGRPWNDRSGEPALLENWWHHWRDWLSRRRRGPRH